MKGEGFGRGMDWEGEGEGVVFWRWDGVEGMVREGRIVVAIRIGKCWVNEWSKREDVVIMDSRSRSSLQSCHLFFKCKTTRLKETCLR